MRLITRSVDGDMTTEVFEDSDGTIIVNEIQDIDQVLKLADMRREIYQDNPRLFHTFVPVFEIPQWLVKKAKAEGWYEDKAKWRRLMNDIDYRKLKIIDGTI